MFSEASIIVNFNNLHSVAELRMFNTTIYTIISLFQLCTCRAQNVQQRKRYVNIVDKVKESCGDVKIFSSLHVTGERK